MPCRSVTVVFVGRQKLVEVRAIDLHGEHHLFTIVHTEDALSFSFSFRQSRQEHAGKDGNDRDNDEQLDKSKAAVSPGWNRAKVQHNTVWIKGFVTIEPGYVNVKSGQNADNCASGSTDFHGHGKMCRWGGLGERFGDSRTGYFGACLGEAAGAFVSLRATGFVVEAEEETTP